MRFIWNSGTNNSEDSFKLLLVENSMCSSPSIFCLDSWHLLTPKPQSKISAKPAGFYIKILETTTISMLTSLLPSYFGQINPNFSEFKDKTACTASHDCSQDNYAVKIIKLLKWRKKENEFVQLEQLHVGKLLEHLFHSKNWISWVISHALPQNLDCLFMGGSQRFSLPGIWKQWVSYPVTV